MLTSYFLLLALTHTHTHTNQAPQYRECHEQIVFSFSSSRFFFAVFPLMRTILLVQFVDIFIAPAVAVVC